MLREQMWTRISFGREGEKFNVNSLCTTPMVRGIKGKKSAQGRMKGRSRNNRLKGTETLE